MTSRYAVAGGSTCSRGVISIALAVCVFAPGINASAQTFGTPMRIAEGPPGQMLVSDSRENVVVAIDAGTLAPLWTFAVTGTPMAVGFASNLVLIGNASTHNVEVYRLKGTPKGSTKALEFQFNLGRMPRGTPGTIATPSDLAIDKDARLVFVLDGGERRIKVFDLDGTALTFLPLDTEPQRLLSPTALAIDPARQEVLVSDYGDPNGSMFSSAAVPARIMVYSYAGVFLSRIDGKVTDPNAQFERPQGLAVDALGRIYMAECVRGEVFVFDRTTGTVVRKLGSFGDAPGQLMLPSDLAMRASSGDLLVTNSMLGRIEPFRGAGGLQ